MKAIVIGGGSIDDYGFYRQFFVEHPFVICCDSGIVHAQKLGIMPDCIMGDFDSAPQELLWEYENKTKIDRYPVEKDYTDMELGLMKALEIGAEEIVLLGGMGSRFDHTFMNAHILFHAEKRGVRAFLINENNKITMVKSRYVFTAEKGEFVSLIPFTSIVTNVRTKGLYYSLQGDNLEIGTSLGISNYVVEQEGVVEVGEGYLLVVISRD